MTNNIIVFDMNTINNSIYLGFNVNITNIHNSYYNDNFTLIRKKDEQRKSENLSKEFEEKINKIITSLKSENLLSGSTWFIDEYNFRFVDFYEKYLNQILNNGGEIGLLIVTNDDNSNKIDEDKLKESYERLNYKTNVKCIKINNFSNNIINKISGYTIVSQLNSDSTIKIKSNNVYIKEIMPNNIIDTIYKLNKKSKSDPMFLRIEITPENCENVLKSFKTSLIEISRSKQILRSLKCNEMAKLFLDNRGLISQHIPISNKNYRHLSNSIIRLNCIHDEDFITTISNSEIKVEYVADRPFTSSGITFLIKPEILKNIYETNKVVIKFYAKSSTDKTLKFFTGKNYISVAKLESNYKFFAVECDMFISQGHSIFRFNLEKPKKFSNFYMKDVEFENMGSGASRHMSNITS